jgi:membrane-bound lytic murein transglycosylase MltF
VGAAVLAAVSFMGVPWAWGQPAAKPGEAPAKDTKPLRGLSLKNEEFTGDFDGMLERRMIRVFVPYSRSLYFNDRGRERGLTADTVRDFERWINRKYEKKAGRRPITVYILPETRENLLPDLARGLGDIAAGNLTVTEERLKQVDFVAPEGQRPVSELLVTGPGFRP